LSHAIDASEEPWIDQGSPELYGLFLSFGVQDAGRQNVSLKEVAQCAGSPRILIDKRVEISFVVDKKILPEGKGDLYLEAPPVPIKTSIGRTSNPKPNLATGMDLSCHVRVVR
jgi:hypothetical protein